MDSRRRISSAHAQALFTLAVVAFLITALGVALWIAVILYYPDPNDRAAFGNMFGGINALFAGFGFAALVYTLLLQLQALEQQKLAYEEQQSEIAAQNARLAQQLFESSFFQLLRLHHEIVDRTTVGAFHGHAAFEAMFGDMRNYANWATGRPGATSTISRVQIAYDEFHKRYRGVLDHYFRNLYHVVKFADQSAPDSARRYTSIIRAQLSAPELVLLLYNGASRHGEKFKPLIETYAMLEHLPDEVLTQPGDKSVYMPSAFGSAPASGGAIS